MNLRVESVYRPIDQGVLPPTNDHLRPLSSTELARLDLLTRAAELLGHTKVIGICHGQPPDGTPSSVDNAIACLPPILQNGAEVWAIHTVEHANKTSSSPYAVPPERSIYIDAKTGHIIRGMRNTRTGDIRAVREDSRGVEALYEVMSGASLVIFGGGPGHVDDPFYMIENILFNELLDPRRNVGCDMPPIIAICIAEQIVMAATKRVHKLPDEVLRIEDQLVSQLGPHIHRITKAGSLTPAAAPLGPAYTSLNANRYRGRWGQGISEDDHFPGNVLVLGVDEDGNPSLMLVGDHILATQHHNEGDLYLRQDDPRFRNESRYARVRGRQRRISGSVSPFLQKVLDRGEGTVPHSRVDHILSHNTIRKPEEFFPHIALFLMEKYGWAANALEEY